jgi:hypothetical protein
LGDQELDINPGMLAVTRSLPAGAGTLIEWHYGSALALPFPAAEFDAACCQPGLQFISERPAPMAWPFRGKSRSFSPGVNPLHMVAMTASPGTRERVVSWSSTAEDGEEEKTGNNGPDQGTTAQTG